MKRLVDIFASFLGLIILLLPMAVIALIIRATMGKPVLFKQVRPGLNGKPFTIYKFRTMRLGTEPPEKRITQVGAFLRRFSLDELPELFNVLKGDMSLVGPRPLLMRYLERYTPEQWRRHNVKPGITGLAQVRGRRKLTFSQRIELDLWYVDHLSIWLDIKILISTIFAVLFTKGDEPGQRIEDVDDLGLYQPSKSEDKLSNKEAQL